ncbi:hypothetical protein GGX14DRAFT_501303 [Mycena pura]|uniref:DUF659 domain-containing protein n=1 Tax=Mycena pura TaxID=153505 RepID=A0AAD6V790_9AGAR|nr:hypothetical protein GGX14DRAFT_501303 [Mycena pura]
MEIAAVRRQACRAIISSGAAYRLFEDDEMKALFDLIRPGTSDILPTGKATSGSLLDACTSEIDQRYKLIFLGRDLGVGSDGWKAQNNNSVNGICANLEYKAYPLELVDAMALAKNGLAQCRQFADIIDALERKFGCRVIYFITDADGGSLKGRKQLGIERPWLFLPSCMAHQFELIQGDYYKVWVYARQICENATSVIGWINNHGTVRVIFDGGQKELGASNALAYLRAVVSRWTSNCTAFHRLYNLKLPMTKTVAWKEPQIIQAQVGAAKSTRAAELEADAKHHCAIINDPAFWDGLAQVLGDIEAICYAVNLAQKDSTRADQALLALVGIYLRFAEHPEEEVKIGMLKRLEKRWASYDQAFFLLALVLNPWEQLSCFSNSANLDHFKLVEMAVQVRISCIVDLQRVQTSTPRLARRRQSAMPWGTICRALAVSSRGTIVRRVHPLMRKKTPSSSGKHISRPMPGSSRSWRLCFLASLSIKQPWNEFSLLSRS